MRKAIVAGNSREQVAYHGGEREHRDVFRWENRFLERHDANIRLLVERDRALEVLAGASFYW